FADSGSSQVSTTGSLKLVVGSKTFDLTLAPGSNNLIGLRDAINNSGAGVTASILTTGTGANPTFLSVPSTTPAPPALQLFDDPTGANTNLLTSANQGSDASFKLNGVPVTKTSNFINDVVSGATFTILKTTGPGESVTLSLVTDRSQLQSAIQDFAG